MRMTIGAHIVHAELYDTPTANAIYSAAPFSARLKSYGEELEFAAPVERWREPDARRDASPQELVFSVDNSRVSLAMGGEEGDGGALPRVKPCNVFGRALGDLEALRAVRSGQTVRLERLED